MNLTLNLENKAEVNPNLAACSHHPFIINDNATATLKYKGVNREDNSHYNIELLGEGLNNLFDIIDINDFAYETGMRDIVNFKEALDDFNISYTRILERMDIDFEFGVTKKYAYKRGTYEIIKKLINEFQRFNMRPCGMHSLFNRIQDNRWVYNNFRDRVYTLERLREKAQCAAGSLVTNLDDLVQTQSLAYDIIIKSTEEANQMSDYFTVVNGIDENSLAYIQRGQHTKINLYTIVKCHAKEMTIIDNNNSELCKMKVPDSILLFRRPLWRALTTNVNYISEYIGASPGARHPYLNSPSHYRYDSSDNLGNYAWGTLCLAAYQDDVIRSLNNRDYKSFVMGLMNWNNIYNKDATNPYASITTVMSFTGFPKQETEEKAEQLKTAISFNMNDCFQQKTYVHRRVELDYDQQGRNEDIVRNISPYIEYILDSCDEQECSLRHICSNYRQQKAFYKSNWPEIIESMIGIFHATDDAYHNTYYYQKLMTSYSQTESEMSIIISIQSIIEDTYDSDGYDYYGNKKEEESEAPIDRNLEEMQTRIAEWETNLAQSGGLNE